MKFTLSWLTDHLATKAGLAEILALMLKAGLEVEEVVDPNDTLKDFTVCKVTAAEPHPDADKRLHGGNGRWHQADRLRGAERACRNDGDLCRAGHLHSRP